MAVITSCYSVTLRLVGLYLIIRVKWPKIYYIEVVCFVTGILLLVSLRHTLLLLC